MNAPAASPERVVTNSERTGRFVGFATAENLAELVLAAEARSARGRAGLPAQRHGARNRG